MERSGGVTQQTRVDAPIEREVADIGTRPLTAEVVAALDEATLRLRVIKPLLEAMGFQDVRLEHGQGERGKDLTCWLPDTLAGRITHAVVAKADRLSGRAEVLNRSIGGVVVQLLQCFGTVATDRRTGTQWPIDRCLVITSREVTPAARDAFWAAVSGASLRSRVVLIDGEQLWDLARWYLPDALPGAGDVAAFPAAETAHATTPVPTAEQAVAPVMTTDDTERQAVLGKVVENAPIAVRDDAVTAPNIAAWRQITANPGRWPVAARLVVDDGTSEPLVFDGLALALIVGDDGRMTFSNEGQPSPLFFRLDVALTEQGSALDLHYELPSRNVVALHALSALSAKLQRPSTLRLLTLPAYDQILFGRTGQTGIDPPDPTWVARLADLVLVQDRTGVPLVFPTDPTAADWAAVGRLGRIARTGRLVGSWASADLTMTVTDHDGFTPFLSGDAVLLRYGQPESFEQLGDTPIPLGPVEVTYASARLANSDDVRAALAAGSSTVTLRLMPGDDPAVERHYLNWGAHDQEAEEPIASIPPLSPADGYQPRVEGEAEREDE